MNWQDKCLAATRGTQLGAILHAAFGREKEAPCFHGKAVLTSDAFVMCDFTDVEESQHWGAFVCAWGDLERNVEGLARHLKFDAADHNALAQAVTDWVGVDHRRIGRRA